MHRRQKALELLPFVSAARVQYCKFSGRSNTKLGKFDIFSIVILAIKYCAPAQALASSHRVGTIAGPQPGMKRCRMCIIYSGHVQGVGFRYTTKTVAAGFEVTGTVRNLPDGRVELIAEGARAELEAFRTAISDAGLSGLIRDEAVAWSDAQNESIGFEIVR